MRCVRLGGTHTHSNGDDERNKTKINFHLPHHHHRPLCVHRFYRILKVHFENHTVLVSLLETRKPCNHPIETLCRIKQSIALLRVVDSCFFFFLKYECATVCVRKVFPCESTLPASQPKCMRSTTVDQVVMRS